MPASLHLVVLHAHTGIVDQLQAPAPIKGSLHPDYTLDWEEPPPPPPSDKSLEPEEVTRSQTEEIKLLARAEGPRQVEEIRQSGCHC